MYRKIAINTKLTAYYIEDIKGWVTVFQKKGAHLKHLKF
jgi:hypothetical protein